MANQKQNPSNKQDAIDVRLSFSSGYLVWWTNSNLIFRGYGAPTIDHYRNGL